MTLAKFKIVNLNGSTRATKFTNLCNILLFFFLILNKIVPSLTVFLVSTFSPVLLCNKPNVLKL